MIDVALLLIALLFGFLTIFSRDNVFSATSLAAAAGAVGAYYAYLAQFAAAFLIFVIYIGAVMLLVIMTAAMYGGVQRWGGRYFLITSLVAAAAVIIGVVAMSPQPKSPIATPLGDVVTVFILLLGVAAVSLLISIDIARRV
ncbi:MAG: hypothetical protein QXF38_02010 [Pyrobaculum sp.]